MHLIFMYITTIISLKYCKYNGYVIYCTALHRYTDTLKGVSLTAIKGITEHPMEVSPHTSTPQKVHICEY